MLALVFFGYFERTAMVMQAAGAPREVVTIARLRIDRPRARVRVKAAPRRSTPRRVAVVPRAHPAQVAQAALVIPSIAAPQHVALHRALPRRAKPPTRTVSNVAAGVALAPPVTTNAPKTNARARYDDAQIAAIERSLGDAIAGDRHGPDPLAVAAAPLPEIVHHGFDANGLTTGDRDHHGLCSPVKNWNAEGFDYYYVECRVRFSDGTFQRQSVPWPVRFKPDADPFVGTAQGGALQGPVVGWHLATGAYISPELRAYAESLGAAI